MKEKINKPKAFISYSSRDSVFIERIETGLRDCQIEPWRDRSDIRDGQPWLDSIFEEGLPTCDVIIAYFTSNALKSDMVMREVDAAQLRLLSDKGVSFLPYVDSSETRDSLRLDLKSRQCRVWNDENFHEVFPSVVASIWRSYTERVVAVAVAQERTHRLEAELELQNLRSSLNASAFSPQEEREFQHLYDKLRGPKEAIAFLHAKKGGAKIGAFMFRVSFIETLKRKIDNNNEYFSDGFLIDLGDEVRASNALEELSTDGNVGELRFTFDFTPTLRIYGLLSEGKDTYDPFTLGMTFSEKCTGSSPGLITMANLDLNLCMNWLNIVQMQQRHDAVAQAMA